MSDARREMHRLIESQALRGITDVTRAAMLAGEAADVVYVLGKPEDHKYLREQLVRTVGFALAWAEQLDQEADEK